MSGPALGGILLVSLTGTNFECELTGVDFTELDLIAFFNGANVTECLKSTICPNGMQN